MAPMKSAPRLPLTAMVEIIIFLPHKMLKLLTLLNTQLKTLGKEA